MEIFISSFVFDRLFEGDFSWRAAGDGWCGISEAGDRFFVCLCPMLASSTWGCKCAASSRRCVLVVCAVWEVGCEIRLGG